MLIPKPKFPADVNRMIDASLYLCSMLLSHNKTFYPFAAICIDGDIQSVFFDEKKKHECGVIEQLEDMILQHTVNVPKSNSLIVYSAYVETPQTDTQDVLVFEVMLHTGVMQQILYPVSFSSDKVDIGTAFMHQTL